MVVRVDICVNVDVFVGMCECEPVRERACGEPDVSVLVLVSVRVWGTSGVPLWACV